MMLEISNLNKKEAVSIDTISNQDFTEVMGYLFAVTWLMIYLANHKFLRLLLLLLRLFLNSFFSKKKNEKNIYLNVFLAPYNLYLGREQPHICSLLEID